MPAKKKVAAKTAASRASRAKIAVENVNVPDYTYHVDAVMYGAMRTALLKMLPHKEPGMTQAEMWQGLEAYVPRKLFPDGGKIGWWMKTVQLDLEAKGLVAREEAKPLRWHKVK